METHAGAAGAAPVGHKQPNYYLIWLILFILTAAEVGLAFVTTIPKPTLATILVGMALWKAMLVAMYYMHLKFEPRRLWIVVIAPVPLAIILVMVVLAEAW